MFALRTKKKSLLPFPEALDYYLTAIIRLHELWQCESHASPVGANSFREKLTTIETGDETKIEGLLPP